VSQINAKRRSAFRYTEEQALGILYMHKFDPQVALKDVANYAPANAEWSVEEKVCAYI
jgi:hypothetical protein